MTKTNRRFSAAERAERRQADRDRLEQAARALLSSDGWLRWVKVRSTNGLSRYSFGNQLLIAMQRPDASYVAGFRAFLELNRCVRKGERAIRILAPMSVGDRGRDASEVESEGEREQPRRTVPYVAGWGETGELDAIRAYAETIDAIARRIEDRIGHPQTDAKTARTAVAA
jgi:hypothetical protein